MPVTYTHTIDVEFDGIVIKGEILLEKNRDPLLKTEAPETLSVAQHGGFQNFLESLIEMYKSCGDIKSISVVKK